MNNSYNQNINNKLYNNTKVKLVKRKRFKKSQKNIKVSRKNRNSINNEEVL